MTYEKAISNQWNVAYHRIQFSKEEHRPCDCRECREYFAALEKGPIRDSAIAAE